MIHSHSRRCDRGPQGITGSAWSGQVHRRSHVGAEEAGTQLLQVLWRDLPQHEKDHVEDGDIGDNGDDNQICLQRHSVLY